MIDFLSVFSTPQAWVELATLIFLEMVLGIDNLVFIAITTDRLPDNKKHIGRRLGLLGALCMRILLLCCVSWLASLHNALFTIPFLSGDMAEVTARDLIMLAGGIYLIYKGISELVGKLTLKEDEVAITGDTSKVKFIGLAHAVGLIMVMDVIFSLDSVITAVGMVNDLPIMIAAVMIAVLVMIIFADPISDFINDHSGVKILALSFIAFIGFVLFCEGLDIELDKTAVYYAMAFALIVQIVEIKWRRKGVIASAALLFAISMVLAFAIPGVIKPYMGIFGLLASFIIVYLQYIYEKNYEKLAKEHALKHQAEVDVELAAEGAEADGEQAAMSPTEAKSEADGATSHDEPTTDDGSAADDEPAADKTTRES